MLGYVETYKTCLVLKSSLAHVTGKPIFVSADGRCCVMIRTKNYYFVVKIETLSMIKISICANYMNIDVIFQFKHEVRLPARERFALIVSLLEVVMPQVENA